jgi:hypothetical protein
MAPWISHDGIILGILLGALAFIFWTSDSARPFWRRLYTYVPALLLCYIIPGFLNSFGVIDGGKIGAVCRFFPVPAPGGVGSAYLYCGYPVDLAPGGIKRYWCSLRVPWGSFSAVRWHFGQ